MSVTGKVAEAVGGEGGQTPLQRFQNTLCVAANEGIRRGELELCQGVLEHGAPRRLLGAGLCPPWGHRACAAMGDLQEHWKPQKDLKAPLLLCHLLCVCPQTAE